MTDEIEALLASRFSAQRQAVEDQLATSADWADIEARAAIGATAQARAGRRLRLGGARGALLLAAAFLLPASAAAAVGVGVYLGRRPGMVVLPVKNRERTVLHIKTPDGRVALWEGPAKRHEGWCSGVIDNTPEDRGAACSGPLSDTPPFGSLVGSLQDGRVGHRIWTEEGYAGPTVDSVRVLYQDGSDQKAQLAHGWFIVVIGEKHFHAGAAPTDLIATDSSGHIVARAEIGPSGFVRPTK